MFPLCLEERHGHDEARGLARYQSVACFFFLLVPKHPSSCVAPPPGPVFDPSTSFGHGLVNKLPPCSVACSLHGVHIRSLLSEYFPHPHATDGRERAYQRGRRQNHARLLHAVRTYFTRNRPLRATLGIRQRRKTSAFKPWKGKDRRRSGGFQQKYAMLEFFWSLTMWMLPMA